MITCFNLHSRELSKPDVLASEVKRMIKDGRANEFVENFAGQWLTLRKLDLFEPDRGSLPSWNDQIRKLCCDASSSPSLLASSQKNMSILTLLDGDFTYLNEELARFYGIPGVQGEKFQKVSLKGQRDGFFSRKDRSWPSQAIRLEPVPSNVESSSWRTSLGRRHRQHTPGVPELEKGELKGTLRERMEQHRSNPACAACHKLMDPLGFALENYDTIGRWRTTEGSQKIDSSGVLPDGSTVKNAGELIRHLRKNQADAFARCLTEKMLTLVPDEDSEYYDRCTVDKIVSKLSQNDYRFSTLVTEIVLSDPFSARREEP